jgi:hypothetical protein
MILLVDLTIHCLRPWKGTNKVEGILIDLPKSGWIHLNPNEFANIKMLGLFISRNAYFSKEPNFLSNGLSLLDSPKYFREYFLSNFCGMNIVVLKMHDSQLKKFKGIQVELLFLIFLGSITSFKVQTNLFLLLFIVRISKT